MFNNFNLSDEEIMKIINKSIINDRIDEDLMQEIKFEIFKNLIKNRKK